MDVPNVPEVLRLVETAEIECRIEAERDAFHPRSAAGAGQPSPPSGANASSSTTSAITADTAESFNLPHNRA